MTHHTLRVVVPVVALAGLVASSEVFGFTFESSVSVGCHENITLSAVGTAGWPDGRTPPTYGREQTARAMADLPFRFRSSLRDPWTMAMVLGVRDNDLRGHSPSDVSALAAVHSDPGGQRAHCLRAPTDDGPDGDARALASCRAFILEEVGAALGPEGPLDLEVDDNVAVSLAFRGASTVPLQRYGFHMGKALHAIQDSFTHTLRAPDTGRVRHVLNFVDWATDDRYSASRDGHAHLSPLDECEAPTEGARRRVQGATGASVAMLRAVTNPAGGRAGRLSRASQVLDAVLLLQPGCTPSNRYCEAPEIDEAAAADGCHARPSGARGGPVATTLAALALVAITGRRRRGRGALAGVAVMVAAAAMAVTSDASAQTRAVVDRTGERPAARWGLTGVLGVSFDEGALAYRVGGHVNLGARWSLALMVEHNPWFSLSAGKIVRGSLNVLAAAAFTWRRFERLSLRSTVFVGASVLLTDLVGADAGSVGPMVGVNLLGVRVPLSSRLSLLLHPTTLMFPVPQIRGVPFYYHQYRIEVGLEWE